MRLSTSLRRHDRLKRHNRVNSMNASIRCRNQYFAAERSAVLPAVMFDIDAAKHSIYLETYILLRPEPAHGCRCLQRPLRWCEVRVLLDVTARQNCAALVMICARRSRVRWFRREIPRYAAPQPARSCVACIARCVMDGEWLSSGPQHHQRYPPHSAVAPQLIMRCV